MGFGYRKRWAGAGNSVRAGPRAIIGGGGIITLAPALTISQDPAIPTIIVGSWMVMKCSLKREIIVYRILFTVEQYNNTVKNQ